MITIQALQLPAVLPDAFWHSFLTFVSEERRAQAARFVHQADAYRSVLGEVLTRITLSELTGVPAKELSFSRNAYGKPCLVHNPHVPFNVSHSGDWIALIAGGTAEVGVDVEKIAPIDLQIAERFFSPQENAYLAAMPADQQNHTFYRLWTLKESYIKAIGTGLSLPLDSFAILPKGLGQGPADELCWQCTQTGHAELTGQNQSNSQSVHQAEGRNDRVMQHRFYSQPLDAQHMLAACASDGELPMNPEIVTLDQIYTRFVEGR
ncbi:4'-phosphopantetheinyl transferase superfamily protein [Paenibacillus barcinonensis]|uniref:4'-phosphopantetheinyl transferase superfamily protein n=1 Tax=Paenibacillus barcinonensis TaxID=198119 RepID=A0A2V4WML2_PAEBA|nr:4'-phosphopantetheinyl transferase superfamily protein [Paenibacillus barcinonensis]PYE48916.1 phosphopantetheine--protein transferase-like protein [Paenibacillus barcinonensis]QKS57676.1 4'-phosphopantetheinyl transferase superfamily protein [Paenibacillus barcinonensis]